MSTSEMFTVELPSRGVLYEGKVPEGKVDLRPMGEQEENLIFSQGGDRTAKMRRVIDNCYLDQEKYPADELLLIDRFYILFMLRVQMFGSVYDIPFRCQACNDQRKLPLDIMQELDKKTMEDGLSEPFSVTLPHCEKEITYRLLRGKDEDEVSRHSKRMSMRSADVEDDSYRYRMGLQIVTVDGQEIERNDAIKLAKTFDMLDANEFRLAVDEVEGGIDLTMYLDCKKCGYVNEMTMPFTVEFFRPSAGKSRR